MEDYRKMMEELPAQTYIQAALVAVGLSALLRLVGKKDAAVFVGQWPPTLILLALAYKLLRPAEEGVSEDSYQAARPAPLPIPGHPSASTDPRAPQSLQESRGGSALAERRAGVIEAMPLVLFWHA